METILKNKKISKKGIWPKKKKHSGWKTEEKRMEKILLDPVSSRHLSIFKMAAKFSNCTAHILETKPVAPLFSVLEMKLLTCSTTYVETKENWSLRFELDQVYQQNRDVNEFENHCNAPI